MKKRENALEVRVHLVYFFYLGGKKGISTDAGFFGLSTYSLVPLKGKIMVGIGNNKRTGKIYSRYRT